ncbi:hypothetical protein DFJ58DRAFT_846767 [Suillus subalutaceus]|uniref:uncharacterized protein n=1 Tax=Suillus subalutaceus TaxID=48586 RepID=UPI001B85B39B|nr:uncharacterized protein DFJ58DRAFT_846767 [Suillus subalutaceus]KAG1836782.1 hypothetical protein DFJ58DRAFT_846767 [Suillus subalutaceus]
MPRSNSSVDSPQKTKQKKLTKEEVLVLKSHLEEWKEAAANDRKKILKAVIKEAKVHAPALDDRSLKNRKYMYQDWLYNRRPKKTRKKASKLGQKWTSRSVIEQLHKEEIIEKTGAMPGSKTFIERYQTTLTAVMASLSKEELEEAQNTAIEWSAKAPPAAIQADFAKKKAPWFDDRPGVQVVEAGRYENFYIISMERGRQSADQWVGRIDFNEKLEGNSFTDTKDWKPMLSEWNAYAGEEFDVDLNNDDDDSEREVKKGRKKGGKKDEYPLEVDSYGLPVILDVKELNLESKKHLIRMFLTKHYRLCSQQPKASVPWASVRKAQGDFITAKFLPTSWKLDDPSKIRLADADRLLDLWCQRQKGHVCPTFEFIGWEGDDKTMRELAEVISRNGSDTRPKDPVKSLLESAPGGWKQVSSSEDKDKDDENEEKDHDNDEEKDDDDDDKKDDDNDGTSPPPKLIPVTNHLPVKKSRPVNMRSRASLAPSAAEHEDPHPPVKKSVPVPLPPKFKPTKKCGRVDHIQSDLESDSRPPRKKSKPNNTSTGSAQSTGAHDNDPPPSNSRAFGPTSGVHAKKKNHKTPVPKPTPTAPRTTGKKAKGREAQTTNPEPKCSLKTSKASYKAQYMQ